MNAHACVCMCVNLTTSITHFINIIVCMININKSRTGCVCRGGGV